MSLKLSKPIFSGCIAAAMLLIIYFGAVSLISGWGFAKDQFSQSWYFIILLASGFGIQFGLYTHLKEMHEQMRFQGVVAVSGTTSTAAMISCCAHYLTNILPILGVTGLVAFVSQYQIELFWFGLFINFLGIIYIWNKIKPNLKVA